MARIKSHMTLFGIPYVMLCISIVNIGGCMRPVPEKNGDGSMEPYKVLTGHEDYVTCLVFLDRGRLATASLDSSLIIWDLETGRKLCSLNGHKEQIYSLALSSDGKILASGDLRDGVICWKVDPAKPEQFRLQERIQKWQDVRGLAFSPDNQTLAINEGYEESCVHLYNIKTKNHETIIRIGPMRHIQALAFSPDNKTLIAATSDNKIIFYDCINNKPRMSVDAHAVMHGSEGIFCVAFSHDGTIVATGGIDKTIRFWDVDTGKELLSLIGHKQIVKSVSFSPDGKLLASGAGEGYREAGELKIWDLSSHNEIIGFSAHAKPIRVVSFSPDGRLVATGSEDKTVKLWKTAELLKKKKREEEKGPS